MRGDGARMNAQTFRILVADDDPDTVDFIATYLIDEGYETILAYDGEEALRAFAEANGNESSAGGVDMVLMDVMMPKMDGFEVCRRIRKQSSVPIIMLTARAEHIDRIVGLEIGADDYVPKPFNPRELVARIKAVMRRSQGSDNDAHASTKGLLSYKGIRLDPSRREILCSGARVELTAREFDLLHFLMKHRGRVFSRNQLIEHVWDSGALVGARTVDVHVRRLRERIEPDPAEPIYIQTVWAVGYRFADEP